jgi:L,D-transpeptidase YcbB
MPSATRSELVEGWARRRPRTGGVPTTIATNVLPSCIVAALLAASPSTTPLLDAVAARLRVRLETAAAAPTALAVADQALYAPSVVVRFYEQRIYRPAWLGSGGSFERVRELLDAIRLADRHGLEPTDYHLGSLQALLWQAARGSIGADADHDLLVDLELAATDAFLVYGAHLLAGRVDPAQRTSDWRASPREADLAPILEAGIASGRIGLGLDELLPASPGYARLQQALVRYRELALHGGWPALPEGPKLEVGATGERVRLLRQRLAATGDLDGDVDAITFDIALDQSVRAFQARHGLEIDGVVGPGTLAALNVPASDRAAQIALNLERWRWLPRNLGRRHLLVNVPAFELRVIEAQQTVMRMRVVVGRPYRRTPIFSATMTYLVLSPYWHVPPGIAVRDVLPAVKKDPAYLAEKGIRVFHGWGVEEREIDPGGVDWKSLSARSFPYRFRQEPGNKNALGRIKFMFPNWYNVYLHDTPLRELFLPARRDFSSGCIRIERPFDLAYYLLRSDSRWSREAVNAAAAIDVETTVPLPEPIPVHILYWTSWADDGAVEFREDIYGRDPGLAAALAEPPPGAR